jgi:hypothetical protein
VWDGAGWYHHQLLSCLVWKSRVGHSPVCYALCSSPREVGEAVKRNTRKSSMGHIIRSSACPGIVRGLSSSSSYLRTQWEPVRLIFKSSWHQMLHCRREASSVSSELIHLTISSWKTEWCPTTDARTTGWSCEAALSSIAIHPSD